MKTIFSLLVAMSLVSSFALPVYAQTPAPAPKKALKLPDVETEKVSDTKTDSLDNVFDQLEYPELQVVPRATERLAFEAQNESESGWISHWPMQVSALSTIYLGVSAGGSYPPNATPEQKKALDTASTTAIGIGGFWLGTTIFYAFNRPYTTGMNRVKKIKSTDKRSDLSRERAAEEALEAPAKNMKSLQKLSMISNVFAAMYVGGYADSGTKRVAFVSALLALTPWIFEDRYVETWEKHLEYKRKIYTPLASVNWSLDKNAKLYPEMTLRWEF